MTEIPQSIMDEARRVVERGYDEGLLDAVAQALLAAERRGEQRATHRCAQLLHAIPSEPPEKPWLIDRDGRVYKLSRKVVLKAKHQGDGH